MNGLGAVSYGEIKAQVPIPVEQRVESNEEIIDALEMQGFNLLKKKIHCLQDEELILDFKHALLQKQIKEVHLLHQEEWRAAGERVKNAMHAVGKKVEWLCSELKIFKEMQKEDWDFMSKLSQKDGWFSAYLNARAANPQLDHEGLMTRACEAVGGCLAVDERLSSLQEVQKAFQEYLPDQGLESYPVSVLPLLEKSSQERILSECRSQSIATVSLSCTVVKEDFHKTLSLVKALEEKISGKKEEIVLLHVHMGKKKDLHDLVLGGLSIMMLEDDWTPLIKELKKIEVKIRLRSQQATISEKLTTENSKEKGKKILKGFQKKSASMANEVASLVGEIVKIAKDSTNQGTKNDTDHN